MTKLFAPLALGAASLVTLAGCAHQTGATATPTPAASANAAAPSPAPTTTPVLPKSKRRLASFSKTRPEAPCFDRAKERYTAVVDSHYHPRPFGGPAMSTATVFGQLDDNGVRFVNYFGIGQSLDMKSDCTYYLDCPGTAALPSIKNDFVNAQEVKVTPHPNLHVVLSITSLDLAHPEDAVETIALYDKEFPGMFRWAGELNVMKQALLGNLAEPATLESIEGWAPFMKIFRERGIPVTLHCDLGNDAEPTKFVPLMKKVLISYPDNKIVWAHMGLSKELTHMDPKEHIRIMKAALDAAPNLMLDISWDVIYNAYHQYGVDFVAFFNEYADRILPGSDFVAAASKAPDQYAKELEITSRVDKFLSDDAFRKIALGENYFRLLDLPYRAPEICAR